MKTTLRLLFTIALLAVTTAASAQFRYGIRIGMNYPYHYQSAEIVDDSGSKSKVGFTGGLSCEYQMPTSGWAFDASLLYECRSLKYCSCVTGESYTINPGTNYLTMPLSVKYKYWLPGIKRLAGPFAYTGPDLAMRLGGDSSFSRPFRLGWNVGVGFDAVNFIQLALGYRVGLNNVATHSQGSIHEHGFNLTATILLDI